MTATLDPARFVWRPGDIEIVEGERGGAQNWIKGKGGKFAGSRPGGSLAVPTAMSEFPPEGQASINGAASAIASYGAEHGTPGFPTTTGGLAAETMRVFHRATPAQLAAGKTWYRDAHNVIAKDARANGYSIEQGAAVTARCSPQRAWAENQRLTGLIMKTNREDLPYDIDAATFAKLQVKPPFGPGTYRPSMLDPRTDAFANPAYAASWVRHNKEWTSQVADSTTILRAEAADQMSTIDGILGGPKVRSFYNNLHDPSDPAYVTIDSLQVRAMTPNGLALPSAGLKKSGVPYTSSDVNCSYFTGKVTNVAGGLPPGIGLYPFFADGVHETTELINAGTGQHLIANQVQAVTWLVQQAEGNLGGT